MSKDSSDKIEREVKEILDRLDNFVPEDRLATKIRQRARRPSTPGEPNPLQKLASRLGRITLGHVLIAGLALMLLVWLPFDLPYERWLLLLGVGLTIAAFVLSVARGGTSRTPVFRGGRREKRWRGQVIEYSEPSPAGRVRNWLRGLHRR